MEYQYVIRKIIGFLLVSLVLLTSCKPKEKTQIEGNLVNLNASIEVKLYRQDFDKTILLESINIKEKKPKFVFKLENITEPTFFHLELIDQRSRTIILLIEPGEKVKLAIDTDNFREYFVSGSPGSIQTKLLSDRLSGTKKSLDSLNNLFVNSNDHRDKELLAQEYNAFIEAQKEFSSWFIWENPLSRASVMALYQHYEEDHYVFDSAEDLLFFKMVASSLKAMYPESEYTKGMLRDIANQERILSSHRLAQFVQESESLLPDITLPDVKGDTISLSSLRGKVILLDFWVSQNQACLLENRELLDIYAQFRTRGFEIYQVSLDTEKDLWLAAIELANLPWINVRVGSPEGLTMVNNYNITSIPSNYLISKEFDIIGKNLFGKELVSKLKELL